MGYYITNHGPDEKFDTFSTDFIIATDEEMTIAKLAFDIECEESLIEIKEKLPSDIAGITYKRFLAYYIRQIQDWMNTSLYGNLFGPNYRPSDTEEATRILMVKSSLQYAIEDYQNGISPKSEYFIYPMSDDEVLSFRGKNTDAEYKPTAEGDDFIPVGATAYHVIDYKRVIPVRVDDRKAFLYDCTSLTDGHRHYIPYHQIFRTEKEANDRITERNTRRDSAIEQYHLLDVSDNEEINRDRETALSWLHYNLDPPAGMTEKLLEYLI